MISKRDEPLVSIITPTYNQDKFIGQCIESVLSQTYSHWEMIIVDDGSTDGTEETVLSYDDPRIIYTRQEHAGIWKLKETYNRALEMAKGELIAVLEGDDLWPPDKLEKQVRVFDDPDVVLSWGKAGLINGSGEFFVYYPPNFSRFLGMSGKEMLKELISDNPIPSPTVMIRKDALLSIGGFKQPEGTPFVDYPTYLELGTVGEIRALNEVLGYWRRHEGQTTLQKALKIAKGANKCRVEFFEHLPDETKQSLGITLDAVLKYNRHALALSHMYVGRMSLLHHNWSEARRCFRASFEKGPLSIKSLSILGIVFSYLGWDMEWIVFLLGRPSLKWFLGRSGKNT